MKKSKTYRLCMLFFILCGTLLFQQLSPQKTLALTGGDFNPGKIIDNSVFFNPGSMSAQQIQTFLNSKVPVCDTSGAQNSTHWYGAANRYYTRAEWTSLSGYALPLTCLKDYTQAVPVMAADTYCTGAIAGGNKSSAQIIYDVSQACGISPKVLIVLLQKEQGLITDDWPWSIQYRSATGYGCPDTAACDEQYYGFFNQVYNAARQFQRYSKQSNIFNYRAGKTSFVQYNPNSACGGTNLYIMNQATAGLYNYTPYQPNQAALNNLYGTGDGCSAYGNRNFWRMFNDWFGSTYSDLITTPGAGIYFIENNTKRAFPSELIFLSYGYKWSEVITVSNAAFNQYPDGAPVSYNVHARDGKLITYPSGGMYVVDNGTKRPFPNEGTFLNYGYKWTDALVISAAETNLIPNGLAMPFNAHRWNGHLVTAAGGMYVVDNGTKRPFPNEITFLSYGYKWTDAIPIYSSEVSLIPDGLAMPYNTHYRDGRLVSVRGGGVYRVDNGQKRAFPSEAVFFSYGYRWSDVLNISPLEIALIPNGSVMTSL